MNLREQTIEACRVALDPSQEGITRVCFRIITETIRKLPYGTFSDEKIPDNSE